MPWGEMCPEAGGMWGGVLACHESSREGVGVLYRNGQMMRNGGRLLRPCLSWMTLWLPEHFNQFHLWSPEQQQSGKEDKVTVLWVDAVFSFQEAVSLYRELCQDPTVLFLI